MTAGYWVCHWAESTVSRWAVARDATKAVDSVRRKAEMLGSSLVERKVDWLVRQKAAKTVELRDDSTAESTA
jgi:hypothetical protein